MKQVLITGATGLLGTALAPLLSKNGIRTVGLARDRIELSTCDETFKGEASDSALIKKLLTNVDAVVHLAALRTPHLDTPTNVFLGNTSATFQTLHTAAECGVTKVVHLSSISILGLSFAPRKVLPAYLPIDELHPKVISDPYALSKAADEEIVRFINNKFSSKCYALRMPFVGDLQNLLLERATKISLDDNFGSQDFWSYIEIRDAISAIYAVLTEDISVNDPIFNIVAPNTLASKPTEELLLKHYSEISVRPKFIGFESVFNSTKFLKSTGFEFKYIFENLKL